MNDTPLMSEEQIRSQELSRQHADHVVEVLTNVIQDHKTAPSTRERAKRKLKDLGVDLPEEPRIESPSDEGKSGLWSKLKGRFSKP